MEQNQPRAQTPYDWKDNATAKTPFSFTGNSGLLKSYAQQSVAHNRIHDDQSKNTLPIEIFNQFFDDSIMEMMVTETNHYAQQIVSSRQICHSSRMNRWKDITREIENVSWNNFRCRPYCLRHFETWLPDTQH